MSHESSILNLDHAERIAALQRKVEEQAREIERLREYIRTLETPLADAAGMAILKDAGFSPERA